MYLVSEAVTAACALRRCCSAVSRCALALSAAAVAYVQLYVYVGKKDMGREVVEVGWGMLRGE